MLLTLSNRADDLARTPPPHERDRALDLVMTRSRLPTPPAVAMRIVQATSDPECSPKAIVELLTHDPAICGQVLKVINSSVYGLTRPVTSVERAVVLLGLNTVRSVVLTFSLPAMQQSAVPGKPQRDFFLASVSGAILARELTVRAKRPFAEDDLVCGLLRDLGAQLLQQAFPEQYAEMVATRPVRRFADQCRYEREAFGVDHGAVTAELLRRWNLPAELVEPIRHHHEPERMGEAPPLLRERAELLAFVEALTNLDVVTQDQSELDRVLAHAQAAYGFDRAGLIAFLQEVLPKVKAFADLLSLDVGACPDFSAVLSTGCSELVALAVQTGRVSAAATHRMPADAARDPAEDAAFTLNADPARPPFHPDMIDAFPAGGCDLDGYELRRVLGRGAMGVVFEGYEAGLDRQVAVKVMSRELAHDTASRARFAREAKSVAAVRHENVVSVYAVREVAGTPYLVMEFVDGGSLEDKLDRDGKLPVPELIDAATQIAAGLRAAHARGIIHRDVKPANLLLDRDGRVKLTDFGLARVDDGAKLSSDACLIGTPLYMAPEQVYGLPLDPRADLFGLGAVLFHLGTGRLPFDDTSTFGVLTKVCEHTPPPVRELRPELPEWFERLVFKLLAKNRDDRFASADEVLDFIARKGEDEAAKKPTGWRKWLPF